MGNKLYKPKKGTRKEKLNKADRLEIAAMLVAAMILLGWAGWRVKDTFWPVVSEVEETETETETEPESIASLEEAAQSEVGTLSKANNWEPQETEMVTEAITEAGTETLTEATTETMTETLTEAVMEAVTEATTEAPAETLAETERASELEATDGKKGRKPETEHVREEDSTEATKTDKPKATPKTSLQVERANKKRRTWLKQQQEERKKQEETKIKAETETETKTETETDTEMETETETETAPEPYLYRSNGILNIRKEPDKGAERLGQCPSGIILDVLEYTEENPRWMKIRYHGITGYVAAEFVLKEDNPEYVG